jgi:hypothetical protein
LLSEQYRSPALFSNRERPMIDGETIALRVVIGQNSKKPPPG